MKFWAILDFGTQVASPFFSSGNDALMSVDTLFRWQIRGDGFGRRFGEIPAVESLIQTKERAMSNEQKLLVVDDEAAICEGCNRIFSRQGFEVEKCCDAAQGLEMATQKDYCAILLDMKMPGMDGIQFLEALRKQKPSTPVVLMTGYPSIPNAASAIRLGVSDYVTKPFTPEEISQAVHRLLHGEQGEPTVSESATPTTTEFRFYRDAWYQASGDGPVRVGAMLVRPGEVKIESIHIPRIGEVVYQGLPLAAVTITGQPQRLIPSPISGVVVEVNESLTSDPSALLSEPCGKGWIACVSPTRLEEESAQCQSHRIVLLSQNRQAADDDTIKLRWLGCDVRTIASPAEIESLRKSFDFNVLLFDGTSFGTEGPGLVGEINTKTPDVRIVVLAATDSLTEPAYRIRRIFYYAVEPFADNEIADILTAVFQPQPSASPSQHREFAQALNGIHITNQNGTRVRLLAAPGLLRHEDGLGQLLRHKLLHQRFPLESSPGEIQITPMNLLSLANRCDRVIVLLAQDFGRLPGCLTRDTKAEYIALVGPGADKVTTILVQPTGVAESPLAFEPSVVDALADHIVREMASA
jgi:DNA-binding response OmpR family regulator